ncbi:MAG TPA: hypothetical protein VF152_15700 [Acidimicrobiia bacterium]
MRWWEPSPDEPELLDWWRPLLLVSRKARAERAFWPVHVDEFRFAGRVERGKRPAIWVYEHRANAGEILVDWHGQTYDFIRYRTGRQLGRFRAIEVNTAIWRARLPDVVEPVWYDEPPRREPAAAPVHAGSWPGAPASVGRRHLTLVPPLPNPN